MVNVQLNVQETSSENHVKMLSTCQKMPDLTMRAVQYALVHLHLFILISEVLGSGFCSSNRSRKVIFTL